jgi:DNA invertase Pin-like site-specific DNA recombinase
MTLLDLDPVAISYLRFSTFEQRKGDSVRRQTEATARWCERNKIPLDTRLSLRDEGVSAFRGRHRSDKAALGGFLRAVRAGKVPRGSFLIIENLDRLTREDVRTALRLWLDILDAGINIVQLSPERVFRHDHTDPVDVILAITELSRGNSESARKSERVSAAWENKRAAARAGALQPPRKKDGAVLKAMTARLPAWVRLTPAGEMELVPEAAGAVRRIFRLAGDGYGVKRILRKLEADEVPPIGTGPKWVRGYLNRILNDRRAVGEYQPRKRKGGAADGEPVPGYFPAVVTEVQYQRARQGSEERGQFRGRLGAQLINPFAGLVKNAREGDAYFLSHWTVKRGGRTVRYPMLLNHLADRSTVPARSFPFPVFERAVLLMLRELNPADVLGQTGDGGEAARLEGELARVRGLIQLRNDQLEQSGLEEPPASIVRRIAELEATAKGIEAGLKKLKAAAARPVTDAWADAHTLIDALAGAKDPTDVRLRLRSALRRIVEEVRLLVVPRNRDRLAAVSVYFTDGAPGGQGRRDYLIQYRPPRSNGRARVEGWFRVRSWLAADLASIGLPQPDLRDPGEAAGLERHLAGLTPEMLDGLVFGGYPQHPLP